MRLSENMQGAVLMTASMAGFAMNDAALKYGGSELGLFQAIFLRGIFVALFIGAFAWARGAFRNLPNTADIIRIALRSVAEIVATLAFLTALFNMPFANITAILQVLPLSIALAAALFLKEPIGRQRVFAIAIGFMGVLIIIRPGAADFNAYTLLGLVAVASVTVRDLIVRQLSPSVSSLFVSFVAAVVILFTGGVGVLVTQKWVPTDFQDLCILAFAAVFLFVGYYCSVAAMRVGQVAVVAPYRYSVMIWAIGLGYFLFNEVPDNWTLVGMSIILVTGLFTMWREHIHSRKNKIES